MNEQGLKDRLFAIAKEKKIHFNECWKKLLLERFLARLSKSSERNKMIFKGGFLLSYFIEIGRQTMDLDFLITNMNAGKKEIQNSIERVLLENIDDGFRFFFEKIEILDQPHMLYPGYRVVVGCFFGKMKDKIQIDIGVGDVVIPKKRLFPSFKYKGKSLFEGEIDLMVYPLEVIFAEKLEAVISKGPNNSRMKDYHDLFCLCREKDLMDMKLLKDSINNTFSRRETPYKKVLFDKDSLNSLQKLWVAHRSNLGNIAEELFLPKNINDVISEINLTLQNN